MDYQRFCPKCGTVLPYEARFCRKCGVNIHEAIQQSNKTPKSESIVESTSSIKKKKKKFGFAKLVGVVLIVLGITSFFKKEDYSSSNYSGYSQDYSNSPSEDYVGPSAAEREMSERYAAQIIKVKNAQESFTEAITMAENSIGISATDYYQKATMYGKEYYNHVLKAAQIARQMGKNDDADEFEDKARQFRKWFVNYARSKGMYAPWID